ncbi:uncharacterized protein UHOD_12076 [Ustilago sp. UG-2017b]|nr:uncharacterized protein UHOD_12076 [Ustilago sp. UG-2017b]
MDKAKSCIDVAPIDSNDKHSRSHTPVNRSLLVAQDSVTVLCNLQLRELRATQNRKSENIGPSLKNRETLLKVFRTVAVYLNKTKSSLLIAHGHTDHADIAQVA